jgi:hypothetical protein
MGIVAEANASLLLEQGTLRKEEAEGVEPRCKNSRSDFADSLFSETKVVSPDHGRVDQEKTKRIGTEFLHDKVRIWVILERFTHFAAVSAKWISASAVF